MSCIADILVLDPAWLLVQVGLCQHALTTSLLHVNKLQFLSSFYPCRYYHRVLEEVDLVKLTVTGCFFRLWSSQLESEHMPLHESINMHVALKWCSYVCHPFETQSKLTAQWSVDLCPFDSVAVSCVWTMSRLEIPLNKTEYTCC